MTFTLPIALSVRREDAAARRFVTSTQLVRTTSRWVARVIAT
jgi:hypothetical protein